MVIVFTVHGIPAPQGSKSPYGGESNPATKPWRGAVAAAAAEAMSFHGDDGTSGYLPPLDGPVILSVGFHFPRPKSHYGSGKNASVVKTSAPMVKASKPDLDKLLRAIGDALTGVAIRDDAQIVAVEARKWYGERAYAVVEIEQLAA